MNYKRTLVAFLALVLVLAAFPALAQETIVPGETYTGTLEASNAQYSFSAAAGDLFVFALNSDDFDAKVEVYDGNGNLIAEDDDSGEGRNALLAFPVAEAGDYTLRVTSWSGEPSGTYTLETQQVTPVAVPVDGSVELATDGANPLYAMFEGEAGDVVNVWAISNNDEDTKISIVSFNDGEQVGEDDDNGPGTNPYVRRLVLPNTGSYLVTVSPLFDRELTGSISLNIETTDKLFVDEAGITVTLGELNETEVFTMNAESGASYIITISSASADVSYRLEIRDGSFFGPGASVNDISLLGVGYTPSFGGEIEFVLDYSAFGSSNEFTVNVQQLSE
ncbi:MAG: hypothetical protein D6712_16445 [Chloroflexi bacterium]|nr:MAG: hypothetical protein D6712_16445 [Chloroflexota bacterium]